MNDKLYRTMKDESGITALETAIILIAFVVVAAIFAFTVLSTGTFLTEKSKEAAYAGLQEVRGSMELKGSVVLESSVVPTTTHDLLVFNLANVSGGSSVDLSQVTMLYRDQANNIHLGVVANCTETSIPASTDKWCVDGSTMPTASSTILKGGNIARIKILLATPIDPNDTFSIEIKPPTGGTMLIERTAPALLTNVTDLK